MRHNRVPRHFGQDGFTYPRAPRRPICRAPVLPWIVLVCTAASAADIDPWTQSATYELEYSVDVSPLLTDPHQHLRVWIPTPAELPHQQLRAAEIDSPWPSRQTQDAKGNRYVYVEPTPGAPAAPELVLRFTVWREPDTGTPAADATPDSPRDPRHYLGPLRRVPLSAQVRELAEHESRNCPDDAAKIRAFYDYVLRSMRYDKSGTGWGEGDIQWACRAGYGNCTDFHSLLIGLTRAEEIPSRFLIGFSIPADSPAGDITGYHCWAEVYDARRGWLPVDASEAWKSKRHDEYFGKLPSDRVAFTVGRDLVLEPRQAAEPLNFLVYPYAEVDGRPVERLPWKLHYRRLENSPAGE